MEEKISRRPHHLDLMNRGTGSVTGIQDVVAFDENQIVLDTDMGLLTVKGKGLHVSRLTLEKGEVDIEGTVDSLVYSSNETYRKQGESLFAVCLSRRPIMDTIYTEWSCMAGRSDGGNDFDAGLRRAPSVPPVCQPRSHLDRPGGFALLDWSRAVRFFPAPQQERGGNAGLYDCFCADWNGFL